ncbi:formamidopyrimidine-DNA glycosylase [Thermopolyspora flexuosa]|jgi:formamidopyrimidine-DNA glycosylase|uniref:DNA-(Apurinic or apyrimidinic site) lyase /formamidopyrimidine-DNA glycosylase n=1 Tax=Thermopolyspora flexuosa TaxID=103836 RepID=A0A543IPG0_9ACTN|nr:DNA-formamidopyrimidine glycosylase family protein [Thermopolyspora flexuosa]TQM72467.1 DNA-(apurinic or apyrimidinic site) lyase /formamidopyrimidine-DNA glycosylase [Thermopolyspora flexuosa]GGM70424.1 formamidopyrimidine-DNA glycosylase [Thermopolyspora flexuosa]
MPELPEVEALAGFLRERAVGRTVLDVEVPAFQALKTVDPPVAALRGLALRDVARHGKFLDLAFGEPGLHLVVHLARGGWLRWRDDLAGARPARPGKGPLAARVRFTPGETGRTPGFELTEAGTQKRLAIHVVRDPAEVPGIATLGPDPLADDFTPEVLGRIVGGSRTRIKGLLRDQKVIAGIGNAYSDEVLHAARMSPFKIAGTLTDAQVAGLHEAIVTTLREAVERARGLAAADLKAEKRGGLRVHGRTGEPCPVCGDVIREVSFADSSLQYCPTCQTGGRPLADRRMSRLLK